jgi:hypothetical protein
MSLKLRPVNSFLTKALLAAVAGFSLGYTAKKNLAGSKG